MLSSEDALKALDEVLECEEKLNSAEAKIYELLSTGVPKVSLKLPRLDASWFSSNSSERPSNQPAAYEPLASAAAETTVELTQTVAPRSEDMENLVEHRAGTAQREFGDLLQRGRAQILEIWKELHASVSEHSDMLLNALLAAAVSLLVAAVSSFVAWGPMVAAFFSVFTNFAGFAVNWSNRASSIFEVLHAAIDEIKGKLGGVLDGVGQQVSAPLEQLHGVLDTIIAEQRPAVEKMENLETTIRQVVPDFDIPTPDDLKRPLTECNSYVDRFVQQAKETLPDHFTGMVEQHSMGRLAVQRSSFKMWIICIPLACILIANLGLCALTQVKHVSSADGADGYRRYHLDKQAEVLGTSMWPLFPRHSRAERNLRGTFRDIPELSDIPELRVSATFRDIPELSDIPAALEGITALQVTDHASGAGGKAVLDRNTRNFVGSSIEFTLGNSSHTAKELFTGLKSSTMPYWQKSQSQLAATLQPVLVQILLSFLQLLAGLMLSQTPWVCAAANRAIASLETRLEERLDERTSEISEQIFDQAFSEVRTHADSFFPKFKLRLSQLRTALDTMSKAQNIVGRLGGLLGLGSAASGGA